MHLEKKDVIFCFGVLADFLLVLVKHLSDDLQNEQKAIEQR